MKIAEAIESVNKVSELADTVYFSLKEAPYTILWRAIDEQGDSVSYARLRAGCRCTEEEVVVIDGIAYCSSLEKAEDGAMLNRWRLIESAMITLEPEEIRDFTGGIGGAA